MFGSLYNHTYYSGRLNRLAPIFFIIKRIVFAYGAFYLKLELVKLISVLTMINVCYLIGNKPFKDKNKLKIEVINDIFAIVFFNSL